MKRPALQFYPGDWQRDAALRSCCVGARGLWIEMLCIMHQAEPYGHLIVNGHAILPHTLARMVGATKREVDGWLGELDGAGAYSTENGIIVCRRMIRDETKRVEWRDRQARHRDVTPMSRGCHAPVTPIFSTSVLQPSVLQKESTPLSGKPDAAPLPAKRLNGNVYYPDAEDVLDYLNKSAGKGYEFRNRSGELTASADRIIARLKQGYTREELREVVHAKCGQWLHDDRMAEYLRPTTLFGKEKFEQYLGELRGAHG